MGAYEEALQRLSRSPIATFIAERKRLAAELRARGDEAGAAQMAKRPKPSTSVWAVNQVYCDARDAFNEMLDAASRLRRGDRAAAKAYHDSIANLRKRAAVLLKEAGYAASDATLRRVATTLAAIAAAGGFDPDPPGALAIDRDPPGFDAIGIGPDPAPPTHEPTAPAARQHDTGVRERREAEKRAAEEAERKRREIEQARRKAERSRIQAALRAATSDVRARERTRDSFAKQLREADEALSLAREKLNGLERQLADLEDET